MILCRSVFKVWPGDAKRLDAPGGKDWSSQLGGSLEFFGRTGSLSGARASWGGGWTWSGTPSVGRQGLRGWTYSTCWGARRARRSRPPFCGRRPSSTPPGAPGHLGLAFSARRGASLRPDGPHAGQAGGEAAAGAPGPRVCRPRRPPPRGHPDGSAPLPGPAEAGLRGRASLAGPRRRCLLAFSGGERPPESRSLFWDLERVKLPSQIVYTIFIFLSSSSICHEIDQRSFHFT